MKIDGGSGREEGTGAYRKNALGQGVVYTVAGNGGQTTGGQLNHPAHFLSLNELGSIIVDVVSNRLDVKLLGPTGLSHDHFTLLKRDLPPIANGGNVTTPEDTAMLIPINASDPLHKLLTYVIVTAPAHG